MAPSRQELGALGEDLAAAELERRGLQVIDRNWRCSAGEVDIIATEHRGARRTLVFCEVKCRTGLGFGDPLEAITWAKLRKLRQLASEWMTLHRSTSVVVDRVRLDAVGVVLLPRQPPRVTYVRGIG